jgi:hypothetical protein
MNDEAESSGAAQRRLDGPPELADVEADTEDTIAQIDDEEVQRLKEQLVKERRLDAKRKRIRMLNELLRELDLTVYMQLIAVYHLEYDTTAPPCILHGLTSLLQLLILLARRQSLHPWQLAHPRVRPDWRTPTRRAQAIPTPDSVLVRRQLSTAPTMPSALGLGGYKRLSPWRPDDRLHRPTGSHEQMAAGSSGHVHTAPAARHGICPRQETGTEEETGQGLCWNHHHKRL